MKQEIRFNSPTPSEYDSVFSNFVASVVLLDGLEYPTVEHAYQAAKTLDQEERLVIQGLLTAGKAKRAGRKVTMREDWEDIKYGVMLKLQIQKFSVQPLKKDLLDTGDASIFEDASQWNDTEWGLGRDGSGKNLLGRALMEARTVISNKR